MAFYNHVLSAKSAEDLLKEVLNIHRDPQQAGEHVLMPQTGHASAQTEHHPLPGLSSPAPPVSPQLPSLHPVPYEFYFTSISTFTAELLPPSSSVQTNEMIREFMATMCRENGTDLHHCVLKVSISDIPGGNWSVAFMPGVLEDGGWMVIFGVPEISEFVWALWPQSRQPAMAPPQSNPTDTQNLTTSQELEGEVDLGEDELVQFFANLVADGSLTAQEDMKVGDERHKQAHGVVQQAVWADQASTSLSPDWRSGEYGGVF